MHGCSLESSRRGDFNEHPQHLFEWRNKQKYPLISSNTHFFYSSELLFITLLIVNCQVHSKVLYDSILFTVNNIFKFYCKMVGRHISTVLL